MSRIRRHTYSPLILYCVFGFFTFSVEVSGDTFDLKIQVQSTFDLYIDGSFAKSSGSQENKIFTHSNIPTTAKVVAVKATRNGVSGPANTIQARRGIAIDSNHVYTEVGKFGWKCIRRSELRDRLPDSFTNLAWTKIDYDDSQWFNASEATNLDLLEDELRNGGTPIWEEFHALIVYCRAYLDECRSSPCKNSGTCIDGADAFTCFCPPGWTGVMCERDIDECATGSICNSGQCMNNDGSFSCNCDGSGYVGVLCDEDIDECKEVPSRCLNGGTCDNSPGSFACVCHGYTGDLCEYDVDECNITETPACGIGKCTNHQGNFSCDCTDTGYKGSLCETLISKLPLSEPKKSNIAVIAGAVVAAVVVVAVIIVLVIFLVIKRRKRTQGQPEMYGHLSGVQPLDQGDQKDYTSLKTPGYANASAIQADAPGNEAKERAVEYEEIGQF